MGKWTRGISRASMVFLPLAAGAGIIAVSTAAKSPPKAKPASEDRIVVRVLTLEEIAPVPRVSRYGTVTPSKSWRAVARIEGEVVWTDHRLANGNAIAAGEELLRIDDSDIRLSLAHIDAQLTSLDVKEQTTRANQRISEETLDLARAELNRTKGLAVQAITSRATVEKAARQEITARAGVVALENQLAINAVERDVLLVQREIAARALLHVSVRAPFAIRIAEVNAEAGQYVSRGQTFFAADGTDAVEISARFPIGRLAPLIRRRDAVAGVPGPMQLKAIVRLHTPDRRIEWPEKVDRIGEQVDAKTQSAAVVITVDQRLQTVKPGKRPPLRRNMFVEVELSAAERQELVVPAAVSRDGQVMIVDKKDRLHARQVVFAFTTGGLAIVASGLSIGDRLVVSDLDLAVNGMAVSPVEDEDLKARLAAIAAEGE